MPSRETPKTVQVEILDKANEAKTFLRDNVDKPEDEKNAKAKILSQKTVKVEQEQKAALPGVTQNSQGNFGKKGTPLELPRKKPTKQDPSKDSNKLDARWVPTVPPPTDRPGSGQSSSLSDKLPDSVKIGSFTAMNSERYLYYSFFSRIEERVYYRWARRVREAGERYEARFLMKKEWVTQIEIVLDKNGYFQDVIIRSPSGIPDFDRAASEAFREGAPFLNPPSEMVHTDGKIHLTYNVAVNWGPY